jgi:hypothetical protein
MDGPTKRAHPVCKYAVPQNGPNEEYCRRPSSGAEGCRRDWRRLQASVARRLMNNPPRQLPGFYFRFPNLQSPSKSIPVGSWALAVGSRSRLFERAPGVPPADSALVVDIGSLITRGHPPRRLFVCSGQRRQAGVPSPRARGGRSWCSIPTNSRSAHDG